MKEWIQRRGYVYLAFVVLFLSIAFASTMTVVFWPDEEAEQTTVGTVLLGDMASNEYDIALLLGISEWRDQADYTIRYGLYDKPVPLDTFDFDIDATLDSIVEGRQNSAMFFVSEQALFSFETGLGESFGVDIVDALDFEALMRAILEDMGNMSLQKNYNLYHYLDDDVAKRTLSSAIVSQVAAADVDAILAAVEEIHIKAETRFSLLGALDDMGLTNDQLSVVASGLQAVIMPTPFSGIIRQQFLQPPTWAAPGKNVRILQVSQVDLTFFNPLNRDFTVRIEATAPTTLEFTLLGLPFAAVFSVEQVTDTVPFKTTYIEDSSIGPDTFGVVIVEEGDKTIYRLLTQEGRQGAIMTFYKTIYHPDGTLETVFVLQDFDLPEERIYRQNTVVGGGD